MFCEKIVIACMFQCLNQLIRCIRFSAKRNRHRMRGHARSSSMRKSILFKQDSVVVGYSKNSLSIIARKEFPETWMYDNIIDNNGFV